MSLTINTNAAAVTASYNLSRNNAALQKSLSRLSSGKRIVQTSDDAGGLAVSMKLSASINRMQGVSNNIQNATSYLDVQDGILQGAAGIVYGRNVIQHPNPRGITQALMAMVHDDASIESALKMI